MRGLGVSMPTYINNQTFDISVRGEKVPPGATIQTVEYLTEGGLTKTSDAPYYNPLQFLETIDFSAAETVVFPIPDPAKCKFIRFQKISEGITVDVYLGSQVGNPVPVLKNWDAYDPAVELDTEYSVGSLILVSSGIGSIQILGTQDTKMEIEQ